MLFRFTTTRDAGPLDTLTTSTQIISIKGFGIIHITMKSPTSTSYVTVILVNLVYISDFMTNLVLQSIFVVKGVYFDS